MQPRASHLAASTAQTVVETLPAIVLVLNPEGGIDYVNPYFEELTGKRLDDIRGLDWFESFLPSRDRGRITDLFDATVDGRPVRNVVNPILTHAGDERDIEWQAVVTRDANHTPTSVVCVGKDVTDELRAKAAEEKLLQRVQNSERQMAEAQAIAKLGSWELNLLNNDLSWSDQIYRLFEIDKERFGASYDAFLDAIHPDDRQMVNDAYQTSLKTREPYLIVHRLQMPDGRIKWVEENCVTDYDTDGTPLRSTGTVQDVTERVIAEQALQASEKAIREVEGRLQEAHQLAHIGVWSRDVGTGKAWWSDELFRICGVDPSVTPSSDVLRDITVAEDVPILEVGMQHMLAHERWSSDLRIRHADGDVRELFVTTRTLFDDDGCPQKITGTVQDITERKRAERELQRSQELLRKVLDASPDRIWAKDADHNLIMVNAAFADAVGGRVDDIVGARDDVFLAVSKADRRVDAKVLSGEQMHIPDVAELGPGGEPVVLDVHKSPLHDGSGSPNGVLAYAHDVTEQRRALCEKETLLREIHHRVKNNLQVISSLLHFQAKRVTNPDDLAAFVEGRTRLTAMIVVHEKLYASNDLSRVNFADYLNDFVRTFRGVFPIDERNAVRVDAEPMGLPIELALPCGMIVCELLTNAMKYAFDDDQPGTVTVVARRVDDKVTLSVVDDGKGMPPDFDVASAKSFGWELVRTLVMQIDGAHHLDATPGGGTTAVISFEVDDRLGAAS